MQFLAAAAINWYKIAFESCVGACLRNHKIPNIAIVVAVGEICGASVSVSGNRAFRVCVMKCDYVRSAQMAFLG